MPTTNAKNSRVLPKRQRKTRDQMDGMKSLIATHKNEPVVSTLAIAELFNRRHDNVLRAVRKVEENGIAALKFEASYIDKSSKKNLMYYLPERTALIIMPFIGGKHAVVGQVKLVDGFIAAQEEIARLRSMRSDPEYQAVRRESKDIYRVALCPVIHGARQRIGKETSEFIYGNFALLIAEAVTGIRDGGQIPGYSADQLRIHNSVMALIVGFVAQGKEYKEIKPLVLQYGAQMRQTLALSLSAS